MIYYNEKVKEYAEGLEKQDYRKFNLYTYGIDSDERINGYIYLSTEQLKMIICMNHFQEIVTPQIQYILEHRIDQST